MSSQSLVELLRALKQLHYRFTTVTPDTHALVNARPENGEARTVEDVFGWNRPFREGLLPQSLFELAQAAHACERSSGTEPWRATVRVASLGGDLFAHSAFPTTATDAVFFGPDSYRFVRALRGAARQSRCAVDIGTGSGVGGIALARSGLLSEPVILADVNAHALETARSNAEAAGVRAKVVESDVLASVTDEVDLVIANPPYMQDALGRHYRHGGGSHGQALSARIVQEAVDRLRRGSGGTLLLYTGSAMVRGVDTFFAAVEPTLRDAASSYYYEELDPDVFASELAKPSYGEVERIAAVFLQAHVAQRGR